MHATWTKLIQILLRIIFWDSYQKKRERNFDIEVSKLTNGVEFNVSPYIMKKSTILNPKDFSFDIYSYVSLAVLNELN